MKKIKVKIAIVVDDKEEIAAASVSSFGGKEEALGEVESWLEGMPIFRGIISAEVEVPEVNKIAGSVEPQ